MKDIIEIPKADEKLIGFLKKIGVIYVDEYGIHVRERSEKNE